MKCDNATNRQMGQTEYPNNMIQRNEEEKNFPNINQIPKYVIYHKYLQNDISVDVNKMGSKTYPATIQLSNK